MNNPGISNKKRPTAWSAIPGYVATAVLVIATIFWTYWSVGEVYYEGWGQPFPAPLAYLVPAVACLALTLIALTWPRFGGWLLLVISGGFTAWWWTMSALRRQLTLEMILSMFPVSGVLVLASVLLLLEARHRRRLDAAGWIQPQNWLRRNLRYVLALGLPLLVVVGLSAFNLPMLLTRFDDGNYGLREIQGNGVTLLWAPAGPGWGQGSNVGSANWSWNDIARYGVRPIGQGDKGLAGDATAEDMRATGLCRYLSADGLTLMDTPQDVWRMPTTDEIVRSLVQDGENAGCTWDGVSDYAECRVTPDKETPLWAPSQLAIYYWSAGAHNANEAYYVGYNGSFVVPQPKVWRNPRHGFRCVRDPED
jgi:hypothetical protein